MTIQPMQPDLMQQAVGTLAHHLNSALMIALLEFETVQQFFQESTPSDTQVSTALQRITFALERMDQVIKTVQNLNTAYPMADYVPTLDHTLTQLVNR